MNKGEYAFFSFFIEIVLKMIFFSFKNSVREQARATENKLLGAAYLTISIDG